jgi:predicted nucleic acid-binding protein
VNVLVDTSVWSLALRRRPRALNAAESSLVAELAELIREGRARIIGPIRQELLSGIRSAEQFEKLRTVLRSFPDESVQTHDYEMAAKASNECRSKGIAVLPVDALICTIAIGRGWPIFSTDPDFRVYSRVLPLVLHAQRGS